MCLTPYRSLVLAIALAAAVTVAAVAVSLPREQNRPGNAQDSKGAGSITILTISGGSLLGGATYSITPDPFTGTGTYSVQDGGKDDSGPASGMIVISGAKNGNYTVYQQQAPPGYDKDRSSKTITVGDNNGSTATFANVALGQSSGGAQQAQNIMYTAKFECGTISGSEGPLRPGHYDTDIGILNKQDFQIKFTWNAIVNNGKTTNSILKTLEPQTSTSVVCNDLRKLFGGSDKFVEGFVVVNVPVDSGLLGTLSGGTAVVGRQGSSFDALDVHVFYTANALEELPHEVLVDKIVFKVTDDQSGKVPKDSIGRPLDVTVRSGLDQVSDPVEKVRAALAEQYKLSKEEAAALQVAVENVSVGAGTMIDDHALSLTRVPAQISS
jgi:hypothetical protein